MATATKPRQRKATRRAREHRRHEYTVVHHREQMIAKAVPIEELPDVDPAEAMQALINRVERLWRYAAAQVDALRPGVAPNQSMENMDHELWVTWDDNSNLVVTSSYWIQREMELATLLGRLTESAQKLGLGERRAKAAEAQTALFGMALLAACKRSGIDATKQKQLGEELRKELVLLEGGQVAA